MPLKEFDSKATVAAKQAITDTLWNAMETGTQDEFEERAEAAWLNGVESGCALSIVTTTISIAAGVAWCEGKRYEPAASTISFTVSDAANTYYLYIDPTVADAATPYKKATAAPGNGYLLLGQVAWDGSATLSSLVDYKRMGLVYHEIALHIDGTLTAGQDAMAIYGGSDGRSFWIEGVKGLLENTGSAGGPNLFAAYAGDGGSEGALWTTGSRRVSIAALATYRSVATGGEPEANRTVSGGQVVRVTCDVAATGAADYRATIYGRLV